MMKNYFDEDYNILKELGLDIKKSLHSPLREDKHKSFSIYLNNDGNIRWKDFGTGEGGTIPQLYELITKTKYERNSIYNIYNYNDNSTKQYEEKKIISIKEKEYSLEDIKYWYKYYIDIKLLKRFNIKSLESFTYSNKEYKNKKYMFSIRYSEGIYKIYMPESKFKFFHNANSKHIFGHHQISKTNKNIIITKSFKDVLVLNLLGYNSISVLCETIKPDSIDYFINLLISNSYKIYLLFDNDKAGLINSIKWKERYNFIKILILDKWKDISDYICNEGYIKTKEYIDSFIV